MRCIAGCKRADLSGLFSKCFHANSVGTARDMLAVMTPAPQDYIDAVQQAMAVVAAKRVSDDAAVDLLLRSFPDDATMASGFLILSEILTALLEGASDESVAEIQQHVVRYTLDKFPELG